MCRIYFSILMLFSANNAFAHVGHLGELAGHSHWIALGAAGVAIALAGLLAGDKSDQDDEIEEEQETEIEADCEEVPA